MAGKIDRAGVLLSLFSILFLILLIEIGLRITKPPITFLAIGDCMVQADDQFGYTFRPNAVGQQNYYFEIDNTVIINEMGFHDINHDLNEAAAVSILALGDSFTAAGQVPVSQGWTQQVEQLLPETAVFNLGLDGTGSDDHVGFLAHYAPLLNPGIVILAFYENDIDDIFANATLDCFDNHLLVYQSAEQKKQLIQYLEEERPSPFAYWLARKSFFYRTFALLLAPNGFLLSANSISSSQIGLSLAETPAISDQDIEDLFARFQSLANTYDFKLFIIPVPGKDNPQLSWQTIQSLIANQPELTLIDVYPAMQAQYQQDGQAHTDLYFRYDGHFNAYGYRLFGQAVATAIAEQTGLSLGKQPFTGP